MPSSSGHAVHTSQIKQVRLIQSYDGQDLILGGASDASDQDPTAEI